MSQFMLNSLYYIGAAEVLFWLKNLNVISNQNTDNKIAVTQILRGGQKLTPYLWLQSVGSATVFRRS